MPTNNNVKPTRTWQTGDKTVVLLPFPAANSKEHLKATLGDGLLGGWNRIKMDEWRKNPKGIKFTDKDVVCADSANRVDRLQGLKGQRDVLYIRGHCSPGSGKLTSSDLNKNIDVENLIALLKEGLSTKFEGIIKIYGCHSGTDGWFHRGFAQSFADEMWYQGYQKCRFYGYEANLSTFSEVKDLGKYERKAATDDNKKVLGAASTRRVEIIPSSKF